MIQTQAQSQPERLGAQLFPSQVFQVAALDPLLAKLGKLSIECMQLLEVLRDLFHAPVVHSLQLWQAR